MNAQVSSCNTTSAKCKELLRLAENARQNWLTTHQASCKPNQAHSSMCNQAYQYYAQRLTNWSTACCSKYDSPKIEGEQPTIEMFRAFEETMAMHAGKSRKRS